VAHASELRLLVLHALRLKGLADVDAIAVATGCSTAAVADELARLHAEELVRFREARASWSLTPEGRDAHAALLADELERAGCADVVQTAYRRVLDVNTELLSTITDLQQGEEVTERLRAVHAEALVAAEALAGALGRMQSYGPRLSTAIAHVEAGEREWIARPLMDSYHSVWHELHEDLMLTLAIDRSAEQEVPI
jgi:hypothetical protein